MVQEKHVGIVLKNYFPKKCKLSLFDSKIGKIAAVPPVGNHIAVGSMIEYSITHQTSCSFLYAVDVHDVPFHLAKDDILFLHHVLEICYYFIPMKSHSAELFMLLRILYTHDVWLHAKEIKKFFLLKLFVLLGLYPEDKKFKIPSFHRLINVPFIQMIDEKIEHYNEHTIDEWLQACIASHPIAHKFKTTHFLE